MGRMFEREVCYTERIVELTAEDLRKRSLREKKRQELELSPGITAHERAFAKRLLPCPICGKTPMYHKITVERSPGGYDYKFDCVIHLESHGLECGDWFYSVSRAGRDWNERVRKEQLDKRGREVYAMIGEYRKELSHQQISTLTGQIFAGDAEGAVRGLKRLLAKQNVGKENVNEQADNR